MPDSVLKRLVDNCGRLVGKDNESLVSTAGIKQIGQWDTARDDDLASLLDVVTDWIETVPVVAQTPRNGEKRKQQRSGSQWNIYTPGSSRYESLEDIVAQNNATPPVPQEILNNPWASYGSGYRVNRVIRPEDMARMVPMITKQSPWASAQRIQATLEQPANQNSSQPEGWDFSQDTAVDYYAPSQSSQNTKQWIPLTPTPITSISRPALGPVSVNSPVTPIASSSKRRKSQWMNFSPADYTK